MGKILCLLGFHKWSPVKGTEHDVREDKWSLYRYAQGVCERCDAESDIKKEISF